MKTDNIAAYLKAIGNKVVKESKELLRKDKGNTALEQSIRVDVVPDDKGFSVNFYMENYGEYLDVGVSGNKNSQSFEDYKGITKRTSHTYTTKGPPIDILSKWIKKKGIEPKGFGRGRSKKTGQYISAFAYLISRKIKREGIKSLSFFQIPFGIGYRDIQENIAKKFKLDVENYLVTYYKPQKN